MPDLWGVWYSWLDWVYPRRCAACSSPEILQGMNELCSPCHRKIDSHSYPNCTVCGKWVEIETGQDEESPGFICGSCRLIPPWFDRAFSFRPYREPLSTLILRYKYSRRKGLAEDLFLLCRSGLESVLEAEQPDWIVSVPLARRKLKERGFDQSFLLARKISRFAGIPLNEGILVRTRETSPQAGLNRSERVRNVRGAFSAVDPDGSLPGSRVFLVDDVMTTGATVGECCRVLKKAKAERVAVFTVARA